MPSGFTPFLGLALAVSTIVVAHGAAAQGDSRTTTVMERSRPELDALGVRWGSFLVLPSLSVSETYDDNIFAQETGAQGDFIADIVPNVVVQSDWNRHWLRLFANADLGIYADNNKENFEDYGGGVDVRLDIVRNAFATAGVRYSKLHEDRSSADDVGGSEPTEYTRLDPMLGIYKRWNKVSLGADIELVSYDYDDAPTSGDPINNDDRDRDRYDLTLSGGFEIVPEYEAFVRVNLNTTDYDDAVDDDGFNRDSKGYEVVAGTRIDLSGVTFGDIFAGYLWHEPDDSRFGSIDGLSVGADLTWNVTKLTTLKLGVGRAVHETTQQDSSGYFSTDVDVSADHELLRNLIISLAAGFGRNEYQGIDREDDRLSFSLAGKYMLNRKFYITLQYGYDGRDSNLAGSDYDKNTVMLRLRGQL